MKPIGGFFELELKQGNEYHSGGIKLNLGRTAFEYILKARNIQKVFLPYYTCDVMLEPIKRIGNTYEFYHIDNNLEPVFDYESLKATDCFLYTNYFGIKDLFISRLAKRIDNPIIDNSQSFYSRPILDVDTFYSPRKFFGLPDGGYLYTNVILDNIFEVDNSSNRFGHLIGRVELGAQESFEIFKENDRNFVSQPIKRMSKITERLLQSIDYEKIAQIRRNNFYNLHAELGKRNLLRIDISDGFVPLVYPYLSNNSDLRDYLIKNKVYVAQYWNNVLNWCSKDHLEYFLTKNLIPIPIDQRYNENDMKRIINLID